MRVLVTGGSGAIGSHVVDSLREHGVTPRVFDLIHPPHHAPGEVETCLGSVLDPERLRLAMAGCAAVIHLAAVADVNDVLAEPSHAENTNTRGTFNVLDAARRTDVGRVIYGSTTWVYSDCIQSQVDEETPIPPPRHLYTATKLAGENYCYAYRSLCDLDYTILRFGIPYGPRARDGAVVSRFINEALQGQPLTIAGDGRQFRKFVYLEDLAEGIVRALRPGAANRIYNLDGTERVTILQVAEAVQGCIGHVGVVHTDARQGDFSGKEISSERARRELGWEPVTRFHDGVRHEVQWRRGRVAEARSVLTRS